MSSIPAGFDINKLKDRSYKGDDFNVKPELGSGPFQNRKCTDVFMCIIFAVFIGGMGFCTSWGYANGNPNKLIAPIDGDGNICGVTPGYEEYEYLFIGDIHAVVESPATVHTFHYGMCVKSCPDTREESMNNFECKPTTRVRTCNQDDENAYASYSILGYCIPEYDTLSADVQVLQEHYGEMEEAIYLNEGKHGWWTSSRPVHF